MGPNRLQALSKCYKLYSCVFRLLSQAKEKFQIHSQQMLRSRLVLCLHLLLSVYFQSITPGNLDNQHVIRPIHLLHVKCLLLDPIHLFLHNIPIHLFNNLIHFADLSRLYFPSHQHNPPFWFLLFIHTIHHSSIHQSYWSTPTICLSTPSILLIHP